MPMEHAVQILTPNAQGGFTLDRHALESILLAPDVANKLVVVVSVAGAFRKGKSFLLDMMLRYLRAPDSPDWLSRGQLSREQGFPWQSGYKRHTTGILMWSRPFPVRLASGEEAVLLLMDTQGTFDSRSTVHDSAVVFALSTLLSSLQIFNLMSHLQSDDLEHLQLFTEYGRLALQSADTTPFQRLLCLIRDWQYPHELSYGLDGGRRLLDDWLQEQGRNKEIAQVRKHIKQCFEQIQCYLMPYPGTAVAGSPNFAGNASDMDPKFVEHLNQLMPLLLSTDGLTAKTIAGNLIKAKDLAYFASVYAELFEKGKLPKPKTILQATAEANNLAAVNEARCIYIQQMEAVLSADSPVLDPSQLLACHQRASRLAETTFRERKKMGDPKLSEQYLGQLSAEVEQWYQTAEAANSLRRREQKARAESRNLRLVEECVGEYLELTSSVREEEGFVPLSRLEETHSAAKEAAMRKFEEEKVVYDNIADGMRLNLVEAIEAQYRQMVSHNDIKKNADNQKAAMANMTAVGRAKRTYMSMLAAAVEQGLDPERLREQHEKALLTAVEMFDSLKQGDESICCGYLESLQSDLSRELENFLAVSKNRADEQRLQEEIEQLREQVKELKNRPPPRSGGFCNIL